MRDLLKSLLLCPLVLAMGCLNPPAPTPDELFDEGHVKDNTYYNDYFGLELDLPADWRLQSRETTGRLVDQGVNEMMTDTQEMKRIKRSVDVTTSYLVNLFRYDLGTTVDFNPSFLLLCENVRAHPSIKRGKDYLLETRKLMETKTSNYTFDSELPTKTLGGAEFDGMRMTMEVQGLSFKQEYLTTIRNGFALGVILTYPNEVYRDTLHSILKGLRFKEKAK